MSYKHILATSLMLALFSCGNPNLPPWLLDSGGGQDTGRDVVDPGDHGSDSSSDIIRDVTGETWEDSFDIMAADDGAADDPTPDTASETWLDSEWDTESADDTENDDGAIQEDSRDTATTDEIEDSVADVPPEVHHECERDQECTPPANLGVCERMKCIDFECIRTNLDDLTDCNDGNMCTTSDKCLGGICTGATLSCDDGNVCTNDYCVPSTGCATSARNNFPCDDGDLCTENDRCSAKVCSGTIKSCTTPPARACNGEGTAVVTSALPGQCLSGSCQYTVTTTPCPGGCLDGNCVNTDPCAGITCDTPPNSCYLTAGRCEGGECIYDYDNGNSCDLDSSACTLDVCQNGVCTAGAAIDCDDGIACTVDGCNDGTGCFNNPDPALCPDDGNACTAPTCSETTGCGVQNLTGGTCDDNDLCTENDTCTSGVCGGTDVVCVVPDRECRGDSAVIYSGGTCNAGECSFNETVEPCEFGCVLGYCLGDPCAGITCDTPPNSCYLAAGRCQDGDCFYDYDNGNSCDLDSSACTLDVCQNGVCTAGATIDCDDGIACTVDGCNDGTGCFNNPDPALCPDDGNACTAPTCSETTGCGVQNLTGGTCDDNDLCTENDTCTSGVCGGTDIVCVVPDRECRGDSAVSYSGGTCNAGECSFNETVEPCAWGCLAGYCLPDPCDGITCDTPPNSCYLAAGRCQDGDCFYDYDNGNSCDLDSSVCTPDFCQDGVCTAGSTIDCDDGIACTVDGCNDNTGCFNNPDPALCPDDGNACTAPTCSETTGCGVQNLTGGTCDDNDLCTENDTCTSGVCGGTDIVCVVPDRECRGDSAVSYSGGTCNAGECSFNETVEPCEFGCVLGYCLGDPCAGITCDTPPNSCYLTAGRCEGGECIYDYDNGNSCDLDSSACTLDVCQNGVCTAGAAIDCDDGIACTVDGCNDGTGCFNNPDPALCPDDGNACTAPTCSETTGCGVQNLTGGTCDDNDLCTENDTCTSGVCGGTDIVCVVPDRECRGDSAVSYSGGTCNAGECGFNETVEPCEFGCVLGYCLGDPCAGITCDTPPNSCYLAAGRCQDGDCFYDYDNGNSCDLDSSVCTPDFCQDGVCTAGSTIDCDDGIACTVDGCNDGTGCFNNPDPALCPDDGNACTAPTCSETTGCGVQNLTGGTCDDNDLCTENDTCTSGVCGGTDVVCVVPDRECRGDSAVIYSGGTCNAGECSFNETVEPCAWGCLAGYCLPDPCDGIACDTPPNSCYLAAGRCQDGDCFYDYDNGNSCDLDSSACTLDVCQNGVCTAGAAIDCDDGIACTVDGCNDGTGCFNNPDPALCPDDGNACTAPTCSETTGCGVQNLTGGTCDDNDLCTENDTCTSGVCGGTDVVCVVPDRECRGDSAVIYSGGTCNAGECSFNETVEPCEFGCVLGYCLGDPCAGITCDTPPNSCYLAAGRCESGDCLYDYNNGHGCDLDSSVCTPDFCQDGMCTAGAAIDCDDGIACTVDGCDDNTGCFNNPDPRICPDDGNECTAPTCDETTGCGTLPLTGGTCDDENACTENDTCTAGECGGSTVICPQDTQCSHFWCDQASGCQEQWLTASCDDGDPCTVGDTCIMGTCGSGGSMNCNDGNPCTTDFCENGICKHPKMANLTLCDDGNPCTQDDFCYNGYCVGATGLNCDDEDPCTTDSCDLDTWTCIYDANNNACDDGNKCTTNDQCSDKLCSGTPISCDDNNPCTTDSCNPATGCVHVNNTAGCEDGNLCTTGDICSGGACQAGGPVDCDDDNVCTTDSCVPSTGCRHDAAAGPCDDGNLCTYADFCNNKTCVGTPISCEDPLPCTDAECNGTDECSLTIIPDWCVIGGQCVAAYTTQVGNPCNLCDPLAGQDSWTSYDGAACDDGQACTADDTCDDGACTGVPYTCNDSLPCTSDACMGDGTCTNDPLTGWCAISGNCLFDGATNPENQCLACHAGIDARGWSNVTGPCSDENECTVDDTCVDGLCEPGLPRNCDDNNVCTIDTCDFDLPGGCRHQATPAICAQARCEGLTLYAATMCQGTACPEQQMIDCDDDNPCTDDQCTLVGCVNTPNTAACDDGNPCSRNDTCSNTACAGIPYSCSASNECILSSICDGNGGCIETARDQGYACTTDHNPCTIDECDGLGACAHEPVEDGTECDDFNVCTTGDMCQNGVCSDGNDILCEPLDQCHVAGECDPLTGECSNPAAEDGTTCDDGNPCTLVDECTGGVCTGVTQNPCTPLDDCHGPGTCNPLTGTCTYPTLDDGTTCNDGNLCTQRDICSKGVCKGLDPLTCVVLSPCHYRGTCQPETGVCTNPPRPDGTTCDDSNACTTGTSCTEGVCGGGTVKTCPAQNNCHEDGVCDTVTGTCSVVRKDDGAPCTDFNQCTSADQCLNGSCVGLSYSCYDGKTCTTDTCQGDGTCSFPVTAGWCLIDSYCRQEAQQNPSNVCEVCNPGINQSNWSGNSGAPCNDFRLDTKDDACVDTVCMGTPYDCSDGLECTEDVCDGLGGASHSLISGYCLIDNQCFANNQVNPDDPCQRCSVGNSTSSWSPASNGLQCDDSEACTYNDRCTDGECAGTLYSCEDGLECTDNVCNGNGNCGGSVQPGWCVIWNTCVPTETGNPMNICQKCDPAAAVLGWSPANEGMPCNDNNPATTDDVCVDGNCIGQGVSCVDGLDCTQDIPGENGCENLLYPGWCLIDNECIFDGNTNNLNRCQICNASIQQFDWSANNGQVCSDNDACTSDDLCQNQECVGTPMTCNDGISCTTDSCSGGVCEFRIDTGWCLIDGQCVSEGTVNPVAECEKCDPDVLKVNWSSNEGVLCDDGNACSHNDACRAKVCRGVEYGCDDGIACTVDTCDGNGGCDRPVLEGWCLIDGNCMTEGTTNIFNSCLACSPIDSNVEWSFNDGAACDDNDSCTWPDSCQQGTCDGIVTTCDDGLACTTDSCNGTGGCNAPELKSGWCMIEGACFMNLQPNPADPCLVCRSDVRTDAWSFRNGVACDDNNACTTFDMCDSGSCQGSAYSCDDGRSCTLDVCDGGGGCNSDFILEGTCLIEGNCWLPADPNPTVQCLGCMPGTSRTDWTVMPGSLCSDFNDCTFNDTCDVLGACGGTPSPCDDSIACTDNVCDGNGGCTYPISAEWCLIEGTCVPDGSPHPTESCSVCATRVNQTGWTFQDSENPEICNGADDNCDGITDPENVPGCQMYYVDHDGDGAGVAGASRCLCAPDGLFRSLNTSDCDDNNTAIYGGKTELCDGLDNNCDGDTDEQDATGCTVYLRDNDADGFGQSGSERCLCAPEGLHNVTVPGDCNDDDADINPGETEICNTQDDNCDGFTDPDNSTGCVLRYRDEDGDGYGIGPAICMCNPRGVYTLTTDGDCNDLDYYANPAGIETCNGIDEDCDGITDNADVQTACPLDEGFDVNGTVTCGAQGCGLSCQTRTTAPPASPWHDTNGYFGDGCECEGDAYDGIGGSTCQDAVVLPDLQDSGQGLVIDGNLPLPGAVDWYKVTFIDSSWNSETSGGDHFHANIQLKPEDLDEFEFAVFDGACGGTSMCSAGSHFEWAVDFWTPTLGEKPCGLVGNNCVDGNPKDYQQCIAVTGDPERCGSCPALPGPQMHVCTNNSRTVYVRVKRHEGLGTSCKTYSLTVKNGI